MGWTTQEASAKLETEGSWAVASMLREAGRSSRAFGTRGKRFLRAPTPSPCVDLLVVTSMALTGIPPTGMPPTGMDPATVSTRTTNANSQAGPWWVAGEESRRMLRCRGRCRPIETLRVARVPTVTRDRVAAMGLAQRVPRRREPVARSLGGI